MSIPAWPTLLPQAPLRQGYSRASGDGVLRTPMEAGVPKARPRFTAVAGSLACAFVLTEAQLVLFKEWWRTSVALGALPFTLSDPEADGKILTVRAAGEYKTTPRSPGRWMLTLDLVVLP